VSKEQGAVKRVPQELFGRPVFLTEKMAALGSAGDIGFFDLSYYIIGDRQTLTIDASTHVYFTYNKTAWRFVIRVDGQPWLNSPITPKNGTATLSPFAILSSTS
jgi:HK97 family phage major capsid protein